MPRRGTFTKNQLHPFSPSKPHIQPLTAFIACPARQYKTIINPFKPLSITPDHTKITPSITPCAGVQAEMAVTKVGKRWRVQVYVNGKRHSSKYFETKKAAMLWEVEEKDRIKNNRSRDSRHRTFADILTRYKDTVTPSKKGQLWETRRIEMLLRDKLAQVPLSELSRRDIADWRDRRMAEVSPGTVNRELNLISHCCRVAADDWEWLSDVPTRSLRRPKNPKPRDRRITQDEIDTLCFAMEVDGVTPIKMKKQEVCVAFLFAIETAMRMGEICSLKPENIKGRVAYLCDTKNGFPRNVPLSERALELIAMLPPNDKGTLWSLDGVQMSSMFKKYRDKCQIEDLTFHDTRHEAITRLAKKLKVLDLARMTGHRDLNMLQIYYNESADAIAEQLD